MPQKRPKRLPTDFFDRLLSNQTDDQINDLLTSLVDEQITPTSETDMDLMPRGIPIPSVRAPQRRTGYHDKIEDSIVTKDEELDELPLVGDQPSALDELIPKSSQMQAAGKISGMTERPGAKRGGASSAAEPPQSAPSKKDQTELPKIKIPGLDDFEVPPELLMEAPPVLEKPKRKPPVEAKPGSATEWEPETVLPPEVPLPPDIPLPPEAPSWEAPAAAVAPKIEEPIPDLSETFGVPQAPPAYVPAAPMPEIHEAPIPASAPEPVVLHGLPSHADRMRTRVKLRWEQKQRKPKLPKLAKPTAPISFAPPKPDLLAGMVAPVRERFQMTRYSKVALMFLLPAFIAFSLFSWYPMIKGMFISFFQYSFTGESVFIGLDNYARAFHDELFWKTLLHAFVYCFLALGLGFWLPLVLSIFINELPLGKRPLKFIFFLPFLMPTVPAAILWKWIMDQGFGLLNAVLAMLGVADPHIGWLTNPNLALLSIVLVYIWKNTGWAILIYSAALGNIDETLYEEAEMNGASIWDKVKMVTLPALRVVIGVMFIITIINTLQLFTEIYIMTNGGPVNSTEVIATYIYKQAFFYMDIGYASSLSVILLLLLLFITTFRLRRLDVEGG